jgi:hypothetical protein
MAAMVSQTHEALLLLFRNRPALAPELLRDALHVPLPPFNEARIESAELTDIQPAEYRADLVVLLYDGVAVIGIVVEVQLRPDEDKRFSWPAYVANLRARIRCPVCLLVVTAEDAVARWAARPIELGGESLLVPLVLGPSGVPEVTDEEEARRDPELSVLSAMAHGRDADPEKALRIALSAMAASVGLDAERSTLYFDLTMASLSQAAREALQGMDPSKYEYQSEFARNYFSQGRAEGEAIGEAKGEVKGRVEGKAEIVLKLLSLRFGPLGETALARVRDATIADLDRFAERVLTAASVEEVLGPG